ncbi:alpha/beta fold hydrolase [Allosalinactinospora lopnorensis]|uniref:alpha/beta fold hydrolase n=1 Tax=Allosalinactinospora lopnorensis TaxID=1352348 RepID=UPI001F2F901D|nr:alpha/beta fold hydrolase [Allosalinactinospora lopnorensis]
MGGAVVTAAAAAAPGRVRSLSLVAPAGVGTAVDADYLRGFVAAGSRRELRPYARKLFADEKQVTRQLLDDMLKLKRIDGVQDGLRTLLGTLLDGDEQAIDAIALLSKVPAPVAVVWGRQDAVLPASNADALAGRVTVRFVDRAGHMAHMENPAAVRVAIESVLG